MSRRYRVLLVDDDPRVLAATARILASSFEVVTATNVDEAIGVLGAVAADVLVTDLDLGEGRPGGEVLLGHARAHHAAVPRVILSGSAARAKEAAAMGLVEDAAVIHKAEVDAATLVAAVRARCAGR